MKTNQYRSHSVAAALAATIVTTVLVGTLVESFEPAQLLQFERGRDRRPDRRPRAARPVQRIAGLSHARSRRPAAGRAPMRREIAMSRTIQDCFERCLALLAPLRPGEGRCVAILWLQAFSLMLAYYLIRPCARH